MTNSRVICWIVTESILPESILWVENQEDCKVALDKVNRQERQERQEKTSRKCPLPAFPWRSWRSWRSWR